MSIMVSLVGVSKLGKTILHVVNPGTKVNGEYYRKELLEMILHEMRILEGGGHFIYNKMGRGRTQQKIQLHTSKTMFLSSMNQ